jgi:hypothetical protein
MKKIRKTYFNLLKNHPTILITILYVYVSILGLVYSIGLTSKYGINIIDYLNIPDLILLAIRYPIAFLWGFSLPILIIIEDLIERIFRRIYYDEPNELANIWNVIFYIGTSISVMFFAGRSELLTPDILFQNSSFTIHTNDGENYDKLNMITNTNMFLFVKHTETSRIYSFNKSEIKGISYEKTKD